MAQAQHHLLCLIIVALLGARLCYSQTTPTADPPRVEESTLASLVKEVEDNSRYKTLEANATLLKLLVDDKDGVSRSEVFDMLQSQDDNSDHMDLPVFPEDAEDARVAVPAAPDSQAEFLQAPGEVVLKDSQKLTYSTARGEPIGTAAGIMILVTCSIVCLAYTGLIVWRRIYLKRYGLKHYCELRSPTRLPVEKVRTEARTVAKRGERGRDKDRVVKKQSSQNQMHAMPRPLAEENTKLFHIKT